MDKASFFILNVFLNSLLAFFTVAFLVEGIIFLFRLPQGRVAAALRMIPIFKLPLDLFLYDFSRWSYAQGVNPLNCEEGTRTLSILFGWINYVKDRLLWPINSCIQLTVSGDLTFTLADVIGYTIHPVILNIFSLLFICFTAVFVVRRLFLYYGSLIALESLAKKSKPLYRKMRNSVLSSCVEKRGVQVLTFPTLTGSPFVAGLISLVIYIPERLSKELSRKEYEAVLAHEIEHVRYKDSLVRLILDFIESIFWWVPTKWLRYRIEEGQEMGCDLHSKTYGVDSVDLASALCKSAKYSVSTPDRIFVHHFTKNTTLKRVSIILYPAAIRFKKVRVSLTCLAVGIAFFVVFLGRFWIF
ncbi:MAG: M56 family metallopeptidase [Parachlamydiaceae bacterium]